MGLLAEEYMNRKNFTLAIVLALLMSARFAEAGLLKNVLQSCAFGAGVMATVTYVGLVSRVDASGILIIPASEAIVVNAVLGCGVGAAGATAATVVGWFYDAIF